MFKKRTPTKEGKKQKTLKTNKDTSKEKKINHQMSDRVHYFIDY